MRSRTVAVALDPGPHPERRTGFALGDMESWIEEPANQRQLLTAVLTLAADWAAVGCPQADVVPMRQYTAWARLAGGFCQHDVVPGFLANAGAVEEMDDDAAGLGVLRPVGVDLRGPGLGQQQPALQDAGGRPLGGHLPGRPGRHADDADVAGPPPGC